MAGDTYGRLFTVTTFGESHGPAMGCVVDGCPPGLRARRGRHPTRSRSSAPGPLAARDPAARARSGEDSVGRVRGRTTGTAIGLLVENVDQRSGDYSKIKDSFRPGHADYTYQQKYGIRDYRGGGRASARETVMRVAAGAIARKYLREQLGVEDSRLSRRDWAVQARGARPRARRRESVLLSRIQRSSTQLDKFMDELRDAGDSIGARINLIASGVPVGLGEPVFDKLEADIAHGLDEHQRGQGRRVRRRLRGGPPARQRAPRRAHARRLQEELVGRHARRNLEWARHPRQHCAQTNVEHSGAGLRPSTSKDARPKS